jgi:hypothetical protein
VKHCHRVPFCRLTAKSVNSQKMRLIAHDILIVGVRNACHIYVDNKNRHIDMKMQYGSDATSRGAGWLVPFALPFDLVMIGKESRPTHCVFTLVRAAISRSLWTTGLSMAFAFSRH